MKKYTTIHQHITWVMILMVTACVPDRGNYDYSKLDPIKIDPSTLQSNYVIKQMEHLDITAKATQLSDDSNLEYTWTLLQNTWEGDPVTEKVVGEVIGTDKHLNAKMTFPPGKYQLTLKVSDKKNDVSEFASASLSILSFAPQGWMILHGDTDSCDVSILTDSRINPDWPEEALQHKIFSTTNGRQIAGEAAQVQYLKHLHNVYVFTHGAGGYRTSGNDLLIMNPYADMFLETLTPSQCKFGAYNVYSYNEMVINDGSLYYVSQAEAGRYMRFNAKCYGQDYYAAPFIATQFFEWGGYQGMIYDQKHQRFLFNNYARTLVNFKPASAGAAFDMNNVGKEMVYAEHGFESKWFCIMKDNDGKYLYICDFMKADDGSLGHAKYDMGACENIDNALYYAIGNRGNVLYYATDGRIYLYNYSGNNSSELKYTVAEPGYKISCMQIFKVSGNPYESRILFVGIYNEQTNSGKLLAFDINETNGSINTGDVKTYEGFKKIASMIYKPQ